MGAWIEIFASSDQSHQTYVAPGMGAWIEIGHCNTQQVKPIDVAPGMGAWIEMSSDKVTWFEPSRRSRYGSVD